MTALVEGHLGTPAAPPPHPKVFEDPFIWRLHRAQTPLGGFGTSIADGRSDRGMARRALPLGFRPVAGEVLMSSHLVFNGVDDVIKQRLEAVLVQEAAAAGEAPGPLPRGSPRDPADRQPSSTRPPARVLRGTWRRQAADRDARRRGDGRRSAGCPGPDRRQARRGDQTAQGQGPARLCLQTEEPQPGRSQRGRAAIRRARRGRQPR